MLTIVIIGGDLQRSKRVPHAHVHVRNYTHKEVCARRVIIADLSPHAADSKIPVLFLNNSPRSILVIML